MHKLASFSGCVFGEVYVVVGPAYALNNECVTQGDAGGLWVYLWEMGVMRDARVLVGCRRS